MRPAITEFFAEHYGVATADSATKFLAFDQKYPNSMLATLQLARENARGMRESISSEAFEQINEFYHFVNDRWRAPGTRFAQRLS